MKPAHARYLGQQDNHDGENPHYKERKRRDVYIDIPVSRSHHVHEVNFDEVARDEAQ